ncbi:MAG TPA: plastocyanin/azurin family copper-binding protein [Actinomycetota bacterium]
MLRRLTVLLGLVPALIGQGLAVANGAPAPHRAFLSPPVQMSSYDDHLDAIVTTDSSSKAQAKALNINYSPQLATLEPKVFPAIYLVKGTAASGQLWVLGSEPGEDSYSPVWRVVDVTWGQGVTPVLLTSDTQIDELAASGDLTQQPTDKLLNSAVIAEDVAPGATVEPPTMFKTFYDGHKDGMLATDVSTKAQATAEQINYSAVLAKLDPEVFPEIYIVRGTMAPRQLMVLGSEPGEPTYSPLWRETIVRWKRGQTPSVIKSDTQVDRLIAAGKVTERETTVLLDCPVTSEPATASGAVGTAGHSGPIAATVAATAQRVRIVDFAFKPKTVTVPKGTRVRWLNKGNVAHTSTSNTGKWDSGAILPGDSFSRVFRKARTYRFHCTIHTGMTGKIVVT